MGPRIGRWILAIASLVALGGVVVPQIAFADSPPDVSVDDYTDQVLEFHAQIYNQNKEFFYGSSARLVQMLENVTQLTLTGKALTTAQYLWFGSLVVLAISVVGLAAIPAYRIKLARKDQRPRPTGIFVLVAGLAVVVSCVGLGISAKRINALKTEIQEAICENNQLVILVGEGLIYPATPDDIEEHFSLQFDLNACPDPRY